MRKFIFSLAAAGAAFVVATPASAQYYPAPRYGANYGFGEVRSLQVRIDNVERQINQLDRRDRIGDRNADRLRDEAYRIEDRLHRAARGGLNPNEARDINVRIQRLEQRVQYSMNDRRDRWDRRD